MKYSQNIKIIFRLQHVNKFNLCALLFYVIQRIIIIFFTLLIGIKEYLISPDSILTILSSNLLIAFYIFGTLKSDPYQIHLTAILIEAILILAIFIFNGFIYTREKKLGMNEINRRAQNIFDQLKQSRIDTIQVLNIIYLFFFH